MQRSQSHNHRKNFSHAHNHKNKSNSRSPLNNDIGIASAEKHHAPYMQTPTTTNINSLALNVQSYSYGNSHNTFVSAFQTLMNTIE